MVSGHLCKTCGAEWGHVPGCEEGLPKSDPNIFMPWSDLLSEAILRQKGGSFTVAFGWSIALVQSANDSFAKWQVFYMAIDASFRLEHKTVKRHDTFREAYDWMRELSKEQYEMILSRSGQ